MFMWVKHLHMTNQQTVLLYIGSFCVLSHLLKRGKHLIVSSCLLRQLCPSSYTQKYIFFKYKIPIFWASLIAQLVKNPPAVQETPVQFLGWEDLLEKR